MPSYPPGDVSLVTEPGDKEKVTKTLALWKKDTDLAGIRGEQELAELPQNERRLAFTPAIWI